MKSRPIFPLVGTVTAVGPNNLDMGSVLYHLVEALRAYLQQRGRHHAD